MSKWLSIPLHVAVLAGGIVSTLHLGNSKAGLAIGAAAALANALLPSPIQATPPTTTGVKQ